MSQFGISTTPGSGYFFDDFGNVQFASGNYAISPGGYINEIHVYAGGDGGSFPGKLCVWDASTGALKLSVSCTLNSGSRSIGGQAWIVATGLNTYIPAGSYLIGIWSPNGVVWTYESSGSTKYDRSHSGNPGTYTSDGTEGSGALGAYVVYTSVPAPVITGTSPTVAAAGQTVTVNGSGFTYASSVTLNGVACSFTIVNDTQLTFPVPSGTGTGSLTLQVTNPSGSDTTTIGICTAPTISSVSPTVTARTQTVTLTGSQYTYATGVTVGGVTASFSITDASHIDVTIPSGAAIGTDSIVVTNAAGNASINVTVVSAPTITSVTPNHGARGDVVQVVGTQLSHASATIGGASCTVSVVDDSHLNVTIPVAAPFGSDSIVVTNAAGNASSTVTVVAAPTITGVSPSYAARLGTVALTGTNFTYVTAVTVGGISASFTIDSSTQITVTIPNTAAYGSDTIVVTNSAGSASSSVTVLAPPTLTSVSPNVAPVGAVVTVTGTNLLHTTAVTVGGVSASFSVTDDTHLSVTVPGGAPSGATTIQATTPAGSASVAFTVGTLYGDNSTSWVGGLTVYADSGTNWQQCSVFVDNGTSWIQVA